jgi:hypothetical protein
MIQRAAEVSSFQRSKISMWISLKDEAPAPAEQWIVKTSPA